MQHSNFTSRLLAAGITVFTLAGCAATKQASFKKDPALLQTIEQEFKDGDAQYQVLMKALPEDKFPKTFFPKTGKHEFSGSGWWCSGFYPGTLFYLHEQTKNPVLEKELTRILKPLEKEQFNKTTHDLGFMMFCSFGNVYLKNPTPEYKQILINSAKSLASRFNPTVGCIRSWDSRNNDFLVIIDNMMNLELLFWATKETGDSSFYNIAVTHANTTMKNHFRPDFSSYHVINYNATDGSVKQKKTAQGYSDASAWARGQAWGLYGFTVMYRATKDKKYLEQAEHIADFILNHPNLPADKIPYWDFNAPDIPKALRDASAGAVMAAAFMELYKYTGKEKAKTYYNAGETMIRSLSAAPYNAAPGTNGGFILQHSVGHIPQGTEVDVPLTYADYYYVEAMKRYKENR
ncbi:glycoside hydrolase family 88 protein [Parasegetibacter sp. NRK P23]|uniref:glycoside hydrolase family 88 protein n=1 Tax=Parasegetibacter sp. NRK P23 TaxID=2942999 RepID=UPI0020438CF5|nr:glycoside hydrolase family 88 protein [Parasegetibacter sp. NRK P23]MCM5530137.1 glycoside hydrolase family 88 protein [Parasegetibacter sp. NRK P23]